MMQEMKGDFVVEEDKKPNVTQMLPRAFIDDFKCNLCDFVSQKKSHVKKHKLLSHSKPSLILRIPLKSFKSATKGKRPTTAEEPMKDMKLISIACILPLKIHGLTNYSLISSYTSTSKEVK